MQKFTLINKGRSRIKVFEPFEDSATPSSIINENLISNGCIYKRSTKLDIQGSRIKSIKESRKN